MVARTGYTAAPDATEPWPGNGDGNILTRENQKSDISRPDPAGSLLVRFIEGQKRAGSLCSFLINLC